MVGRCRDGEQQTAGFLREGDGTELGDATWTARAVNGETRIQAAIFTLRLDVADQPQILQQLARTPVRTVECTFAQPVHLRTLGGEDLGTKDRFTLPFDVLAGLFVYEGGP